jgi:hypothetical protein
MNALFGKCGLDRKLLNDSDLERVRSVLRPYGPDHEERLTSEVVLNGRADELIDLAKVNLIR